MASLPMSSLARLNSRMLKYSVKRYTLRRGALMFGKMLPVGIGAVVGGAGNRMAGKKIVAQRPPGVRRPAGALAGHACTCCRRPRSQAISSRRTRGVRRSRWRISGEGLAFMGRKRPGPPQV